MLAWRDALPEYDPAVPGAAEKLDAVLLAYVNERLATATRPAIPMPVMGYSEQVMPTAEVHGLRLALWPFRPWKGETELRAEVNETLAEDSAHPLALEYHSVLDRIEPTPLARRAVAAHPGDPRAYTFLARSLTAPGDGPEREAVYRKALELSPRNPAAYFNLGQELQASGRPEEALPFVRQAAQLAPWSTPVLAGYASVLADLGQCDEAEAVRRSALDAMPEASSSEERWRVKERLGVMTGKCGAGTAGGVGAASALPVDAQRKAGPVPAGRLP
jgi:tetratricopeptide (TPR) repeat protein